MQVKLLLADAAQVDGNGKASALGLGWTITGSPMPASALVLLIDIGWEECNDPFTIDVFLEDSDGKPVMMNTPTGHAPITAHAEGKAGRPAGIQQGGTVRMPLVLGIGAGIILQPGQRYVWRVEIKRKADSTKLGDAREVFTVRK